MCINSKADDSKARTTSIFNIHVVVNFCSLRAGTDLSTQGMSGLKREGLTSLTACTPKHPNRGLAFPLTTLVS